MGQFRETAVEKQLENFASMIFMKAKQMILLEPTLQRAVSSETAFLIPGCCQRTRDSQKWARRIPGWWWRVGIPGESVIILKAYNECRSFRLHFGCVGESTNCGLND